MSRPAERVDHGGAPAPLWAGRTLALIGIVLVAFNLRSAVASLSPILAELEAEIELGVIAIGVLGMLPPLCYAVFGIVTPSVAKRFGLEVTLVAALAALTVGLAGRGLAPDALWLVLASALTFAAIGVGNVLLPPLVKRYFPDRVGLMTTVYATAMAVSTFVPPLVAVPVATATHWRISLGEWAVFAALSLIPWIVVLVRPARGRTAGVPREAVPSELGRLARSRLAWALTTIFTVSGFNVYALFAWLPAMLHDLAGTSHAESGALLSWYAAMGLPASILVPLVAARFGRIRPVVYVSVVTLIVGYGGLLLAPATATWLWVALAGIGPLLFPLSLVLINLRTRTPAGSVALSGFVQSVGYLLVAAGPLLIGGLHEWTGGWTWPILILAATAVPAAIGGLIVARPRMLEDELAEQRAHSRRER
ncbi:MFS transporter [Agromyces aerolatus]|uniref:MFS transporter n=1 Tax=Agromyces sp. LY-1074 TaxID=3074080 RepID=UPI00285D3160|nr:MULTISPECIES: MFS transporter [unclassified Agromyces]MDR5701343.1 MFS transporter [Agromyces sp. LY-1074]MDR5707601.1 MFS transporter [Agromyces sp. LY-1358]